MSGINNLGDKNRWVGRVLSYESQKEQLGGDSRGCRYRVAIMGKHPLEGGINDDEITFATVSQKTGSGGGGFRRTCKYPPGDIVHGFYNDSEQQQPVIEGSYGRTKGIKYGSGRFDSKSGYFGKNQPGNLTGRDESNEQVNDCLPRAESSTDKSKFRTKPIVAMDNLGIEGNFDVGSLRPPLPVVFTPEAPNPTQEFEINTLGD